MYTVYVLRPDGTHTRTTQPKAPQLNQLQAAVGGYIETIPHFRKFGGLERGTAYCNEDGIGKGLPVNPRATIAWLENLNGKALNCEPTPLLGTVIYYAKEPER